MGPFFWNIITCTIILVLGGIVYSTVYQYTYWRRRKTLFIDSVPHIGHVINLLLKRESFINLIKRLYVTHPDAKYYGSFDFGRPALIIKDPEIIKEVCIKNFESFPDHRSFITEEMDPVFGSNVFSLTGQRWKEVRNTLTPTFTANKMKFMFKLIHECARDLVRYFEKDIELANQFEAKDVFTRYTNDVIATVAFGLKVDSLEDKNNDFYEAGKDVTDFSSYIKLLKFTLFRLYPNLMRRIGITFLTNKSDKFLKKTIRDTVTAREKHGIVRPDMIQLLIQAMEKEDGVKFTLNDIIGQAFIFFLAGFDTSSTLMCLLCHQLAAYPDIQDRLIKEIDSSFQNASELSYDSLVSLKYLDMVINETLRLYPNPGLLDRVCVKECQLPPPKPGYPSLMVEKDTIIMLPVLGMHYDPKYFNDPEKFDPERFNDENKVNIDPCVYMPFGVGPRKCIGNRFALMETKLLIIHILLKFRIEFTSRSEHPIIFSKKKFGFISDNGYWLRLKSRNK